MDTDDTTQVGLPLTTGCEEAARFQCDLYRYWHIADATGGLGLTARRFLTRASLRTVRREFTQESDTADLEGPQNELSDLRLFFSRRLLERLGLLQVAPAHRLVASKRADIEQYLSLPLAERLRICARAWLTGGWWIDEPGGPSALPDAQTRASAQSLAARLEAVRVLRAMEDDPVTLAIPPTHVSVSRNHGIRGGKRETQDGRDRDDAHESPRRVDALVADSLLGPLNWLGFVSLDNADGMPAGYVRLIPSLAARALHKPGLDAVDDQIIEPSGKVIAQPNFEVIAFAPLTGRTLATLDACSERHSIGYAARYTLTQRALNLARQTGWRRGEVAARVARVISGTLPQNVRTTLDDWDRQADKIQLRADLALVQVEDGRVLDMLMADPHAAEWIERRISPVSALVRERSVDALRDWLLRHAEMPRLEVGFTAGSLAASSPGREEDREQC